MAKPKSEPPVKERMMKVACKNCRAQIDVRNAAKMADEISISCPKCGRRFIYNRAELSSK